MQTRLGLDSHDADGIQLYPVTVAAFCRLGLGVVYHLSSVFLVGHFASFRLGGFAEWRQQQPVVGLKCNGARGEHAPCADQGEDP